MAKMLLINVEPKEQNPNQLSMISGLFMGHEEWLAQSLEIAGTIPGPFYFSDLRRRLGIPPHHPNAYGSLAKALMKNGFRRTGEYRRSPTGTRRGGIDWCYEKE